MKKSLEQRYLDVIENNVNVGKTNDFIEFLKLIAILAGICFVLYFGAGLISDISIDRMSNETQLKLEKMLSFNKDDIKINTKSDRIKSIEKIKPKIVALDKNLQGKSDFTIFEADEKEINAFVIPDGTIYFTKGLLDKVSDERQLTFILAHELGHYAHRDHLKSIGRELILGTIVSVVTFGNKSASSVVNGLLDINNLKHSQKQEIAADLYANRVLYKLYGENSGGVNFFKMLKREEKLPEFLYYFSTHPSTDKRLYLIQNTR